MQEGYYKRAKGLHVSRPIGFSVTQQMVDVLCKIHIDSCRHNAIVPSISPVAEIVWQPLTQVIDHASKEVYLPPSFVPGARRLARKVLAFGILRGGMLGAGPLSLRRMAGHDVGTLPESFKKMSVGTHKDT